MFGEEFCSWAGWVLLGITDHRAMVSSQFDAISVITLLLNNNHRISTKLWEQDKISRYISMIPVEI